MRNTTDKEINTAIKNNGISVSFAHSFGGGKQDPNRDHRSWEIEFMDVNNVISSEGFVSIQVHCPTMSGRIDGKSKCEKEAKIIAKRKVFEMIQKAKGE